MEDLLRRGDGVAHEELGLVHRNGLRLLRLVNTLLDFSRIEAGRVDAVYEPTDLAAYTADLASAFRSAAERAGLELVVDTPAIPEPVYVDREMWEKVVLNLLSNAFKHTFEGRVQVSLRPAGASVELEVRDTGVGIATEQLPHLFERFHRVPNARSRTHEGTGIGLALVRELVKLHGGEVRVWSAEGTGSAFTVAIPRGSRHLPSDRVGVGRNHASTALGATPFVAEMLRWLPDASHATLAEADAGGAELIETGGARILLADDNADMRDYVARLLRERGWTVQTVADGRAALEMARQHAPDLVLSDVMMPGLDGFALLRELRAGQNTSTVPVVLLSARAGEESRVEGMDAGADDYLVKPFSARELLARVGAQLTLARLRREHAEREQALRSQAEALQEQDQFLRLSLDLLCIMDLDGRFTRVNPAFRQVLGYTDAELLGRSFLDFVHADDRKSTASVLKRLRSGETLTDFEHRYRDKDGAYRMLAWNAVPAPDGLQVYATARDRTEAYHREVRLRESEARLQFAVEAAQLGFWDLDVGRHTAWRSLRHDQIFGYERLLPSWTYEMFLQHVVPEDREAVDQKFRQAMGEGTDWELECRITRADGQVRWIWVRGTHVRDATGATQRMVGGVRDITERKLAEEHLRQFERMDTVGRLAGGVAHEANNMMSVVLGSAEFILARHDIPSAVRVDAMQIREAAQRTASICAQLLAFSRRQITRRDSIDLNAVVAALEPILQRTLGERTTLNWQPEDRLAPVSADRGQIEQVLLNLVLNARDAMAGGGMLSVETANMTIDEAHAPSEPGGTVRPGPFVALRVSDTGNGMSPETLAHCFEPFYTSKGPGKGTGLGLSTVHGIVHQHDGFIRVASELGRGTAFTIFLPAATDPVSGAPVEARAPKTGRTGTILVAEDEESVRQIAARALTGAGYAVLEAADGEAALARLRERQGPVDLVLTDINMPVMDGRALAAHLAMERPDLRVILMSGDPRSVSDRDDAPGALYVQK
ncbi:MAG: response regulator, partial [Gemmatimonadales bacterium]|nr:response regulator [Gemmatimonadales bacterium]